MKKIIALLLAALCLVSLFAGCGKTEDKKPADGKNDNGGSTADDTPVRTFDDPRHEALVVVAEAYNARRAYLQYDDTRLVTGNVLSPAQYRWERHQNSPEDSTKQFTCYTNCAAWTYDVYKEALDLDIQYWNTAALDKATEMHVFRHVITGKETPEEKKEIEEKFRSLLQIGDILCCRHDGSSGHAMLYVGEGQILHSAAPGGGNYDYGSNLDKVEPRGSIAYKTVDSLFSTGDDYYFFEEMTFSIVRPLLKYPDATVSEKTQNRIANLQNLYVEMTSSHGAGQTAQIGEEITFTFSVRNSRTTEATVEIKDVVPENVEYVSGAEKIDGKNMSWTLIIPSGETKEASYTVKVKNDESLYDGESVYGESATVGGVSVRCRPVYIGRHLSTEQMASVSKAAKAVKNATVKGTDLAEKIYADAGITIALDDTKTILDKMYKPYQGTHFELNMSGSYANMVVPTMFGGYNVTNASPYHYRTRGILAAQLYAGDIILCVEGTKIATLMYAGDNVIVDLEKGNALDLGKSRDAMLSTLGYTTFLVIRPGADL